jgi:hypothetical protein
MNKGRYISILDELEESKQRLIALGYLDKAIE